MHSFPLSLLEKAKNHHNYLVTTGENVKYVNPLSHWVLFVSVCVYVCAYVCVRLCQCLSPPRWLTEPSNVSYQVSIF